MSPHEDVPGIVADFAGELLEQTNQTTADNFFAVRGRSLLALRLIMKINKQFDVELPFRSIYEAKDFDQFVDQVRRYATAARAGAETKILPQANRVRLPASLTQFHIFAQAIRRPTTLHFNLPFPLHIAGPLDVARLEIALHDAVQLHESLRVSFEITDRQCWQVPHDSPDFDLTAMNLVEFPATIRSNILETVMDAEDAIPVNLTGQAQLRAKLVELGCNEHVLLLHFHHIAADGQSIRIFVADLFRLYENAALVLSEPAGRLQFADIVAWQAHQLQNGSFRKHIDYWREALAPPWQPHKFRHCAAGDAAGETGLHSRQVMLAIDRTAQLQRLAAHWSIAFHALYVAAIAEYLMQHMMRDVRIAIQINGRTHPEFETVVGPLVSTVVLRMDLSGGSGIRAVAELANKKLLEAYEHADPPPEAVMRAISEQGESGLEDLCQILLVMDDVYPPVLRAADLIVTRYVTNPAKSIRLENTGPFAFIFAVKWTGTQFGIQLTANSPLQEADEIMNCVVANLEALAEYHS